MPDPDPRTQPDDLEDATPPPDAGVSSDEPAEGADDAPEGDDGSPD